MDISCNREKLASAFAIAATVANARSPKAILQYVKLVVDGVSSGMLMATDMESGISIKLDQEDGLEIHKRGQVLLPVARFQLILRESREEFIHIRVEGKSVKIETGTAAFDLPMANPDEYPNVERFTYEAYHELSARLLRECIRRTSFATDDEGSRYALGGVLVDMLDDGTVIAVGTDGRRLAKMEGTGRSVSEHAPPQSHTIVPVRSLALINRAIGESKDDELVAIAVTANQIFVRTPRATIVSRLVEGRFPNWKNVLPNRKKFSLIDLPVGAFLSAIRQAAIVADSETHGLDFEFTRDSQLVISTRTADLGQSRVSIPIEYDEGESIPLKLDYRYVTDFLRLLDPESRCTANIASSSESVLLTTDDGYSYVVMPMALER